MPAANGRNGGLFLQSSVGLLRGGKIAGGQVLAELVQLLEQGILVGQLSDWDGETVVIMVKVDGGVALALEILLECG